MSTFALVQRNKSVTAPLVAESRTRLAVQPEPSLNEVASAGRHGDERDIVSIIRTRRAAWQADELADLLSLSRKHIYKLCKQGRIPHYRLGTAVRFDPILVAAWLERKALN